MSKERLYLFDTTLRDGQQTPGIDFSLEDKILVARMLDELGHRLCRGRLSRRQPDRHGLLRAEADEPRHLHRLRHGEARRPLGRERSGPAGPACARAPTRSASSRKAWDFHVQARARLHQRGEPRSRSRNRSRRRSPPGARRCSTASTSSTATRPIPTTRSPASRRRSMPARAGRCSATPMAARFPTRWRRSSATVVDALSEGADRHPRAQRHRPGGGEFARRGARRRAADPGHAERHRRALRQRRPRPRSSRRCC